jgi:MYXO-CTERM domain-containing protein
MKPKSKVPRFPLDIRHSRLLPVVISPFLLTNAFAANVTLNTSNAAGASSFASATSCSNAAAPSAGNDYFVTTARTLRTVADSGSATFAGGSLTLGDNTTAGILILKNQASGAVVTINSLTLNNGEIQAGATSTGAVNTIAIGGSGITLANSTAANRLNTGATGRGLVVSAPISGSGALSIISAGTATLTGTNSCTGATTITSSTRSIFLTGSGDGLVSGDIKFATGNILSVSKSGSGAWNNGLSDHLGCPLADDSTITLGTNTWRFNYNDLTGGPNFSGDQAGATGFVTMTVIPEPAAAGLGSLGLLALLRRRRGTGGNSI